MAGRVPTPYPAMLPAAEGLFRSRNVFLLFRSGLRASSSTDDEELPSTFLCEIKGCSTPTSCRGGRGEGGGHLSVSHAHTPGP